MVKVSNEHIFHNQFGVDCKWTELSRKAFDSIMLPSLCRARLAHALFATNASSAVRVVPNAATIIVRPRHSTATTDPTTPASGRFYLNPRWRMEKTVPYSRGNLRRDMYE